MQETLLALLMLFLVTTSVHAADKIRFGYPDFNSSTFTLPLAHLRGFFEEEGLQAELIRIRSAMASDQSRDQGQSDGSAKSFNEDGSVPEPGLCLAMGEAKKAANITREVAFDEVADFMVLRQTQKEIGIK